MDFRWMDAKTGPGAGMKRDYYFGFRNTEERALESFRKEKAGPPECEISKAEYDRLRALYEAEWEALTTRGSDRDDQSVSSRKTAENED
jgi:hypothetical protein